MKDQCYRKSLLTNISTPESIGANLSTTLWGPRKWQGPKGQRVKLEGPKCVGYWEGTFPSPPTRESGERCKLSIGIKGEGPATWRFRTFLANVNSCYRPSVCRLSVVCLSVCNVRAPYSGGSNFRQSFYGIWYPSHPLTSTENFTEIVPGEPLRRGS